MDNSYGHIQIHIAELVAKTGISKSKLCYRAELQRTQLNRYCNNTVMRLDVDVLARLCTAFHCEIGELLEFIPDAPSNPPADTKQNR